MELSPPHIKHPALGSQGGIWELLSLQEAWPAQRREQWEAGSKLTSGRTHTGATEQAATMALAVSQAENTPPAPKKGFIPL